MTLKDITIIGIDSVTGFDIGTNNLLFMVDELQKASISQEQATVNITGRRGRLLNTLKRNKTVTVKGTNGLLSGGLTGIQTGREFENGVVEARWIDRLIINSDSATTTHKATGPVGEEITALFVRSNDGTIGAKLQQGSSASEGIFAYDPNTRILTFDSGAYADGTGVVVFYKRKVVADFHKNPSTAFSKKCKVVLDAIGEDKCSNVYRLQFQFDKVDFKGEFEFNSDGSQVVHGFEFTSLPSSCGKGKNLWTYVILNDNTRGDATLGVLDPHAIGDIDGFPIGNMNL